MSDGAEQGIVLVVDDLPQNVRLLDAVLSPRGYEVRSAGSGKEALAALKDDLPDLVLLDILMPGMDGYEVCHRIRGDPATAFLPVVMITASGDQEKLLAIEAGADDFVTKPFNQGELLARVRSLVRVKRYHDTIERQTAELAAWNRELEARVAAQVEELERVGRLRRFLAPQLADLIVKSGDESFLTSHRREITVAFCDLRGFTAFAETAEPEEVMDVLNEYHCALGDLIHRFEGTLEHFAGDGLMVFFNDPLPCPDGPARAVRMAVAMRTRARDLAEGWTRSRPRLGLRDGHRPWLCHPRTDRVRWAVRLRRNRHRDQPGGAAVRRGGPLADSGQPEGAFRHRGHRRQPARGRTDPARIQQAGPGVRRRGIGRRPRDVVTAQTESPATLRALSEEERYRRFDRLQEQMADVWRTMRLNESGESVVVVPSVTVDRVSERSGTLTQAFEERFLFLLLLLRQPRLRMIYVTSLPIAPSIVDYYLALLPGIIPSHARARLDLVSVNDASPRPLSEKLLERPRLLAGIASMIPDRTRSHLVPYNTTALERDVAVALGIPMYGADPRHFPLGTKSGCRRLFAEEGVNHPLGYEDLHTIDDVVDSLLRMRAARPTVTRGLVKLNEGVSGAGNALVAKQDVPSAQVTGRTPRTAQAGGADGLRVP